MPSESGAPLSPRASPDGFIRKRQAVSGAPRRCRKSREGKLRPRLQRCPAARGGGGDEDGVLTARPKTGGSRSEAGRQAGRRGASAMLISSMNQQKRLKGVPALLPSKSGRRCSSCKANSGGGGLGSPRPQAPACCQQGYLAPGGADAQQAPGSSPAPIEPPSSGAACAAAATQCYRFRSAAPSAHTCSANS